MHEDFDKTMKISSTELNSLEIRTIISKVYSALEKKGYAPISQIVGYIMSGDPSYITSQDNARALIRKLERDDLLEEFVKFYVENLETK
ncbi:IreB family regulatory phosphoprotein [Treponema sp. R6D11]